VDAQARAGYEPEKVFFIKTTFVGQMPSFFCNTKEFGFLQHQCTSGNLVFCNTKVTFGFFAAPYFDIFQESKIGVLAQTCKVYGI
jgi:hypothetical protein